MARFPRQEADIIALAERLWKGLVDNTAVYPNPPYPGMHIGSGIRWKVTRYRDKQTAMLTAQSVLQSAGMAHEKTLLELTAAMKKDLRYAENIVDGDDNKLKLLGWSGKRAGKSLAQPGQVGNLTIAAVDIDAVRLQWQMPPTGGQADACIIYRRSGSSDKFSQLASCVQSEIILTGQPRGRNLEYYVSAVNKAGNGPAGNTVNIKL
jgi:hypothetical protein